MEESYRKTLIVEKMGKIHEFSDKIMKETFEYCEDLRPEVEKLAQNINKDAYCIKTLIEQISGLLRN